ncbi:MAG: hypothetical protein HY763_01790, partial [Planctomycetes bacterium]|nr:hypothetical protein [Planctomycetota bacterium]
YQPSSAPLVLAGYPGGLHLVFNGRQGRELFRAVSPGETVQIVPGLGVRVESLWANAVADVRPYVVPPHKRDRDARENFAMIRLEVATRRGVETRWVPYNPYVLPGEQYAYAGRFPYTPERIRLPDGGAAEVVFSRQRRKLPAPIALDGFELDTHIGGYSGSTATIRNYLSYLRFWDGRAWTVPTQIAVNSPTEYGGYWYFQSMWDKPPSNAPGGGMNYTGLGVGNRNGVYVQLAGCCISVAGMIFAFYVKPVLKRRRAMQSRARAGLDGGSPSGEVLEAEVEAAAV